LRRRTVAHVNGDGTGHRATLAAVTRKVCDLGAGDHVLAWHAGDIGTGAAHPTPLDNGGPSSQSRHVPSEKLAARAAAKDESVKLF
jgi:hypothetical protein